MNFRQLFMLSLLSVSLLFAQPGNNENLTLDRKIASLIVIGFHGTSITPESTIVKDIEKGLGGVILFDQDPVNKSKRKNILNAKQLRKLDADLQNISEEKLLICVDEEGGKVARLKAKDGFETFTSAEDVAKDDAENAQKHYGAMAKMLSDNGINIITLSLADTEQFGILRLIIREYDKAKALLDHNLNPTDDEIRKALNGVLCRCTGYVRGVDAVQREGREEQHGPLAAGDSESEHGQQQSGVLGVVRNLILPARNSD